MKTRVLFCLFCACLVAAGSFGQGVNLIANGDFENIGSHPIGPGELDNSIKWANCNGNTAFPYGTPDLFTAGGSGGAQWPNTFAGTVVPQSGTVLAGFITSNFFVPDFREYVSYHLEGPMIPGETYTVSFWLTNGSANWYGGRGSNNIGAAFTLASPAQALHEPLLSVVPQLELTSIIHQIDWQQYTFTFSPSQPFEHLTIGNFRDDANTSIGTFTSGAGVAYYFIDNGTVTAVAPLPVAILDLHQIDNHAKMELAWTLPQSIVGDALQLERSMDQKDFVLVEDFGRVDAPELETHFVDADALPGRPYFYRLRDVNANGAVTYSNMVYAEFGEPKGFVAGNVYPSPAQDLFALEFTALANGDLNMRLFDTAGRLMDAQTQSLVAGQQSNAYTLPEGLAAGIYRIVFDFAGEAFSRKVVVSESK